MTDSTLLLRQVHPIWIQSGRVASQAFTPTPKDGGRLSVYDGDQITPEQSWRHFTDVTKCASAGVLAVSVAECARSGLATAADPDPFPEHAVIDFSGVSGNLKREAKTLKCCAEARGWLHRV